MNVSELVLAKEIVDNTVYQCGCGYDWLTFDVRLERDQSAVRVVLPRQTAEPFTGPAASSTTLLLNLQRNELMNNATHVMRKVLTDKIDNPLGIHPLKGIHPQHGQPEPVDTDAFCQLLQVKFDSRPLAIGQVRFWLEKNHGASSRSWPGLDGLSLQESAPNENADPNTGFARTNAGQHPAIQGFHTITFAAGDCRA